MKKIIFLLLISVFNFSNTYIEKLIDNTNDEKIVKFIEENSNKLTADNKYVVKTSYNLAPKLVTDIIFLGEKIEPKIKMPYLLITYLGNEKSNYYIYDNQESIEFYKQEFDKRNVNYNNIKFIEKENYNLQDVLDTVNHIIDNNEKEHNTMLDNRLAIILDANKTKIYKFIVEDYLKRKNSNYGLSEFSYLTTDRMNIDENSLETIKDSINLLTNYYNIINK